MNQVKLKGIIRKKLEFSHENNGEKYYKGVLCIKRSSRITDYIPFIIAKTLLQESGIQNGQRVQMDGHYLSGSTEETNNKKMILYVEVESVSVVEEDDDMDVIEIEGEICRKPKLKKSRGGKDVCEVLLVVKDKRKHTKNFIPCMIWENDALAVSKCMAADRLYVKGRIQSRTYKKDMGDGIFENHIAYEVYAKEISVF